MRAGRLKLDRRAAESRQRGQPAVRGITQRVAAVGVALCLYADAGLGADRRPGRRRSRRCHERPPRRGPDRARTATSRPRRATSTPGCCTAWCCRGRAATTRPGASSSRCSPRLLPTTTRASPSPTSPGGTASTQSSSASPMPAGCSVPTTSSGCCSTPAPSTDWASRARPGGCVQDLLSRSPGHPQARSLKNRLDASLRPWSFTMGYGGDRFSDDRTPWAEYAMSISRQTPVGSVIARASHVERFGLSDRLFEVEMYPTLPAGHLRLRRHRRRQGRPPLPELPRRHRPLPLGRPRLRSVGGIPPPRLQHHDRHLPRPRSPSTPAAGCSPARRCSCPTSRGPRIRSSFHAQVRRYIGGSGESYLGAGYSHGYSREELGDRAELTQPRRRHPARQCRRAGAVRGGCCRRRPAPAGRNGPSASRCGSTRSARR